MPAFATQSRRDGRRSAAVSGVVGPAVGTSVDAGDPGAMRPAVLTALEAAYARLDPVPGFAFGGRLIRPVLAYTVARDIGYDPEPRFWRAALAVQLAHEASLAHDDIIDGGAVRRGRPTHVAEHGPAAAILYGDHLLTAGYRVVASTAHPELVERFALAVERTVAAERALTAAVGRRLCPAEYRELVVGKTGELLGFALAIAPALHGWRDTDAYAELGRRMGLIYQMTDDLLDYCPRAVGSKAVLTDYDNGRWTWVLEGTGLELGGAAVDAQRQLFAAVGGRAPHAGRLLQRLDAERQGFHALADRLIGRGWISGMVEAWCAKAEAAVAAEVESHAG